MPLDELVLFVRAGAILCLQAQTGAAPIQYADQMGGALAVQARVLLCQRGGAGSSRETPSSAVATTQVYAGRDGAFTLVEDDGASLDYATGDAAATRRTAWAWDDAAQLLSWNVTGGFAGGPNLFTSASVTLFVANASAPVTKGPVTLGASGTLQF